MPASLFVVATPIGNLDDITLRALNTLKSVELIAAEDTRRTGILLRHFGITTPTTSFHAHNERQKLPQILQRLAGGANIALVSDAGTPLVADPGQRLVAAAIELGATVVPIPGPSAVLAALAVSGLGADTFVFMGFAPAKTNSRVTWLSAIANETRPVVFFEAPHRIRKTLQTITRVLAKRPIIVCRELTKLHEETLRTTTDQAQSLSVTERGEFTIVIGPQLNDVSTLQTAEDNDIYSFFCHLIEINGLGRRPALAATAKKFGLSTKQVYSAVERLKRTQAS
jgi:16S rRNA (cytidine1402-2'-O)-methyltransferase